VIGNSNYLAKFCFNLGIALKRVEVIADDEAEIIEAARRMSDKYDFVVTSGGIGPTLVCFHGMVEMLANDPLGTTTSRTSQ